MNEVLDDLIWPAAAGNVAWAFVTVFLEAKCFDSRLGSRLSILFLLAIYLAADWQRSKSLHRKRWLYWTFDLLLMLSIVVFAIAIQQDKDEVVLKLLLTLAFGISIGGHLSGARETPSAAQWRRRVPLATCSLIGLIVLLIGTSDRQTALWNLSIAFGMGLLAWVLVRLLLEAPSKAESS